MNVFVILRSDSFQVRGVTPDESVAEQALERLNKDHEMSGSHAPPFFFVEWPMSETVEHLMESHELKKEYDEYKKVLEQIKKLSPAMQAKLLKEHGH